MDVLGTLATTIIPALLPAATDGVRAAVSYFSKGAQKEPANFSEQVKLMEMDIKRLQVIGELDKHNNGNMPWWVDAIKTLQRPFFGVSILSGYMASIALNADTATITNLGQYVSMFGFYLFGERAYMNHQIRNK